LVRNGTIKFIPGQGTYGEFDERVVAFPPGARLEYRVQRGDRFFEGDHIEAVGSSLWVIAPDGSKNLLASGYSLYMRLVAAARNLKEHGITLRAVSFYKTKDGQIVEQEISIPQLRLRFTSAFFLGLSDLWLGAIAAVFIHNWSQIITVGAISFLVLAIIRLRYAATSKRSASVELALMLLSYPAGYFAVVLVVRSVLSGLTRV
jgi:hypothetical protein